MSTRASCAGICVPILVGALVSSLGGGHGTAAAAEKSALRLNLKTGQVFRLRFIVDQKIQPTIGQQQVTSSQRFVFGHSFQVQDVDTDSTATVKVTYDSIAIKQGGGLMPKLEYDSNADSAEVPRGAREFAAVVGTSYTMRIAPTGRVLDVQSEDEIVSRLLRGFGMTSAGEPGAGNAVIKAMLEQFTIIYPDGPVAVGDSWITHSTVYMGFPLIAANAFTLRSRQDGLAVVAVASNVQSPRNTDPAKMGETNIRYELTGTHKGKIQLDESTGWIVKYELTEQVSGKMIIEGQPRSTEAQVWPVTMESVFRVEPVR